MEIKIGELAKRTGCEVVTIRYYEKEGLLPEPARSDGNFRLYGRARRAFAFHPPLPFSRHVAERDPDAIGPAR
jgi:hypothetical protein